MKSKACSKVLYLVQDESMGHKIAVALYAELPQPHLHDMIKQNTQLSNADDAKLLEHSLLHQAFK